MNTLDTSSHTTGSKTSGKKLRALALTAGMVGSALTGCSDSKENTYSSALKGFEQKDFSLQTISCDSQGVFTIKTTCDKVATIILDPINPQVLFHTDKAKFNGEAPRNGDMDTQFVSDLENIISVIDTYLTKERGANLKEYNISFDEITGHSDVFPDIKVRNLSDAHTGKKFQYNPEYRHPQEKTANERANMFIQETKDVGFAQVDVKNISSEVIEIPNEVASAIEKAGKYIRQHTKLSKDMSDNAYHALAIMLANESVSGKYTIDDDGSQAYQVFQMQLEKIRDYGKTSHTVTTNSNIKLERTYQTIESEKDFVNILGALGTGVASMYIAFLLYQRRKQNTQTSKKAPGIEHNTPKIEWKPEDKN